jgi:CRP-like cAMP-binding protein
MDITGDMRKIRSFVEMGVSHPDEEWKMLEERLRRKVFKKGELVCATGAVETKMYFVVEGILRSFYCKHNTEYTIHFAFPVTMFNSFISFANATPSEISVESISESVVYFIAKSDLEQLYECSRVANVVSRKLMEKSIVYKSQKEIQLQTMTAEEFYRELQVNNPEYIKKIPQKYLASYLGIAPESLSRIRSKLKNNC